MGIAELKEKAQPTDQYIGRVSRVLGGKTMALCDIVANSVDHTFVALTPEENHHGKKLALLHIEETSDGIPKIIFLANKHRNIVARDPEVFQQVASLALNEEHFDRAVINGSEAQLPTSFIVEAGGHVIPNDPTGDLDFIPLRMAA
jgi:hypothetical protein